MAKRYLVADRPTASPRPAPRADAADDDRPAGEATPPARLGNADARATSGARTSTKASGTLPEWLVVKKQIGDRCLASTKQELSRHSGAQFDLAFMGQQLVAHMKVVDELTVYREHASRELRRIIESELQMAKAHLELARQTLDQISAGGDAPPRTARRPGSADAKPAPKPKTESRPQK